MKKSAKKLTKKSVYVLRHTNLGCPEAGMIESVYATQREANAAMKETLQEFYEVTPQDNVDNDYAYMFVSKHPMYSKK